VAVNTESGQDLNNSDYPRALAESLVKPAGNDPAGDILRQANKTLLHNFLHCFIGYIKARRIYPSGHERLAKQLTALMETAEAVFTQQSAISLFVQPKLISVSGMKFGTEDSIISEFIPKLIRRFIRFVIIKKGVTAEELDALAEPILMKPEALKEAGGAERILEEKLVKNITIYELSYKMENFLNSEEDMELVSRLAQYEHGVTPEPYVMRRMEELGFSPKENKSLRLLLHRPEVHEKLTSLRQLFGEMPGGVQDEIHTSDLMMYLVRSFSEAESESGGFDVDDLMKTITHVLEELIDRLTSSIAHAEETPKHDVLNHVARKIMTSPDSMLQWLSLEAKRLDIILSPNQAEMLKVVFSRRGSGPRKIQFGDTELETLTAVESDSPARSIPRESRTLHDAPVMEEVVQSYYKFQAELGASRFFPDLNAVPQAHMDILVELMHREKDDAARKRILKEFIAFLGRCRSQGRLESDGLLIDLLKKVNAAMGEEELAGLLQSAPLCRQVLWNYVQGEEHWQGVLHLASRMHPTAFAAALESLLLDRESGAHIKGLSEYVRACQDRLVSMFIKRLSDTEVVPDIQRITTITHELLTPRMVSLIRRMLEIGVDDDARIPLMRKLVEIDDVQAIRLVSSHLDNADASTREKIIHVLGDSKNQQAERILMELANQSSLFGTRAQARLTALESLKKNVTGRSMEPLKKLARKPTLLLTGTGWKIRAKAREIIEMIEDRRKAYFSKPEE
jgi:hypothetical protein